MKSAILALAILLGAMATPAQTYTQTSTKVCRVATLDCQNIPLTGTNNDYTFNEGNSTLSVGAQFILVLDGTAHQGSITQVITQVPGVGGSGAFSFTWSTTDGLSGSVSGQMHWFRGGRSWYAEIDSSTVTVQ